VSILELRAKARRIASRQATTDAPLGLIVIDYLQLMKMDRQKSDTRDEAIGEVSRGLKGWPRSSASRSSRSRSSTARWRKDQTSAR
jgi:replicative DNA helicase